MSGGKKQQPIVVFQPLGRRGYVVYGKTIKDAAQELGFDIESVCAGKGICGKCKVKIIRDFSKENNVNLHMDNLSPISNTEKKKFSPQQLLDGYRLACQARIQGDVAVFVPAESREEQIVRKAAREIAFELKPVVRKYHVRMPSMTMDDISSDWEHLQAELREKFDLSSLVVDYSALVLLPNMIRQDNREVTASVWRDREVIKIEPGFAEKSYGLAVDIGTTTVAAYLCDLTTGEIVATDFMMNPQVAYGEDVISRIDSATRQGNLESMKRAIIKGVNQLARQAARKALVKREAILDMTVVGNTCMHHLFLGIDPRYLGKSPFSPVIRDSLDVKASELGIKISPGAYVHILPIEAGFVGADNVGVLLAEELYNQDEIALAIDIGTNGELVLGNRKKLFSCSCATGPAFEGAQIKDGMRAAPGAIEKIMVAPNTKEVHFRVIGKEGWNTGAKGICGSGIIDAVAQLLAAGVIDRTGRFNDNLDTPRLRVNQDEREFVIAWAQEASIGRDIVVCQQDIRNIQIAKAAMYAGAKILMRRLEIQKLDKIILAGAFGSYIDKESAATIGLFPDCPQESIYAVGNAAGDGARIALLNIDKRTEAKEVAREVEYVELASEPDFAILFSQAMWFPHMKDSFPNLRKILPWP